MTLILCSAFTATLLAGSAPLTKDDAPVVELKLPAQDATKPQDYPGLHNVVGFGPGLYSGSAPEGDAGFSSLAALGIRTIISVDGAAPELARANARGLRYVHLPIGYNGFDETRKLEMTRAVRDLPKPIYMHCHHGKHRSAGGAAAVGVSLGTLTNAQAIERMKVSGTAADYEGLYRCAEQASVVAQAVLDAAPATFPEVSRPSGLVHLMVETDGVMEHLKAIEKAGWTVPKDHPDLVPVAEAGRLADLLRNTKDDKTVTSREDAKEFLVALADNAAKAQVLEDLLLKADSTAKERSAQFKLVTQSCKDCHVKHRD
ncbi:MAG: hypothetical protein SGJ11_05395 [Phycisphaerae bacterium]|nr:hypothetical protein [Phycisphaerae bacterium]